MERCVAAASHHGCGICTCLHVFRLPLKGTGGRRTTGMYRLGAPGYIDARWPNCRMSNALTCPEVKSPSDYGDAFPISSRSTSEGKLSGAFLSWFRRWTSEGLCAHNPFKRAGSLFPLECQSSTQKTTTSLGPWTPTIDCISISALREGPLIKETL